MNQIKHKVDIYYSDTDSIFIDKKDLNKIYSYLDDFEIGKFKIVGEIKTASSNSPTILNFPISKSSK
jgi:hypothetical protein